MQTREQSRDPIALFSYGFRPFFLLAAAWAALVVTIWIFMIGGRVAVPTALSPIDWHAHELIYGYGPAVIAGFLLTAVPNWTRRPPMTGGPLIALVVIWMAGRLALLVSIGIGAVSAAVIDSLFLPALGAVAAREIIVSNNTRNLKVVGLVGLLAAGNVIFHIETVMGIGRGYGLRLGIGVTILLIALIGGRIIPSFTRNWLLKREAGPLPADFGKLDAGAMVALALAIGAWIAGPESLVTAGLLGLAGALHGVRLARWAGNRTMAEPLVLVLHVAYVFVPIGCLLLALSILRPDAVPSTGAVHAWTAGAIGTMTLAVMTRASLGHTGQPLTASPSISIIYVAVVVAALARIAASFGFLRDALLGISALAWILAFGLFVVVYSPLLLRRNP